jgi:hypothetical protein
LELKQLYEIYKEQLQNQPIYKILLKNWMAASFLKHISLKNSIIKTHDSIRDFLNLFDQTTDRKEENKYYGPRVMKFSTFIIKLESKLYDIVPLVKKESINKIVSFFLDQE